jgi:hypothetical protein
MACYKMNLAGFAGILLVLCCGVLQAANTNTKNIQERVSSVSQSLKMPPKVDFNADGYADLFLINPPSGLLNAWWIKTSSVINTVAFPSVTLNTGWVITGLKDANADKKTDLYWSNGLNGNLSISITNGTGNVTSLNFQGFPVNSGYFMIGLGDFNGDGNTDFLWYNVNTGNIIAWLVNGVNTNYTSFTLGALNPASGFIPLGLKDLNGDKITDIFVYNPKTGQVGAWLVTPPTVSTVNFGTLLVANGWQPVSLYDFNGDGTSDMLVYNTETGFLNVWYFSGKGTLSLGNFGTYPGKGFILNGYGDFNGDKTTDLLWSNNASGLNLAWLTHPNGTVSAVNYPSVSAANGWFMNGIDDFNADGNADLLWYNVFSNQTLAWLLNGGKIISQPSFGVVAKPSVWNFKIPR